MPSNPCTALFPALLTAALLGLPPAGADAQEKVIFGTNWKAEAEHGGFYQAKAMGLYEKYGLEVTIRQGGPQVNHAQLLAADKIDFNMGGNLFSQFNFDAQGIPVVTVAAFFQKEPQALFAHPGSGVRSFEDLRGRTLFISTGGRMTFWRWLKAEFGLEDSQIRPYTFNPGPFVADPESVQQGYVSSEPYAIERVGGFKPVVLLMADAGYDTYSTILQVKRRFIEERPEVVQAFVDASIEGWYHYLYGDPTPGNELIKQENPDMTDGQIAFSRKAMLDYGLVDSGDALTLGIGAMTDARWQSFFEKAVGWGLYPADLPYREGYTLAFVNRGHGLELKRRLLQR